MSQETKFYCKECKTYLVRKDGEHQFNDEINSYAQLYYCNCEVKE